MWNIAKNAGKHIARGSRRWIYDDPTLEHIQNVLMERTTTYAKLINTALKGIINYIDVDFIPKLKLAYNNTSSSPNPSNDPSPSPSNPTNPNLPDDPNNPDLNASIAKELLPPAPTMVSNQKYTFKSKNRGIVEEFIKKFMHSINYAFNDELNNQINNLNIETERTKFAKTLLGIIQKKEDLKDENETKTHLGLAHQKGSLLERVLFGISRTYRIELNLIPKKPGEKIESETEMPPVGSTKVPNDAPPVGSTKVPNDAPPVGSTKVPKAPELPKAPEEAKAPEEVKARLKATDASTVAIHPGRQKAIEKQLIKNANVEGKAPELPKATKNNAKTFKDPKSQKQYDNIMNNPEVKDLYSKLNVLGVAKVSEFVDQNILKSSGSLKSDTKKEIKKLENQKKYTDKLTDQSPIDQSSQSSIEYEPSTDSSSEESVDEITQLVDAVYDADIIKYQSLDPVNIASKIRELKFPLKKINIKKVFDIFLNNLESEDSENLDRELSDYKNQLENENISRIEPPTTQSRSNESFQEKVDRLRSLIIS